MHACSGVWPHTTKILIEWARRDYQLRIGSVHWRELLRTCRFVRAPAAR